MGLWIGLTVAGARLDAGEESQLNNLFAGDQERPVIAQLANGSLAAVWESEAGGSVSVWMRLFSAAGLPLGTNRLVFQQPGLDQCDPSVVALEDGGFAVAWSRRVAGECDVAFLRCRSDGAPAGPGPEQANVLTDGPQFKPQLASLPGGGFVAVWVGQTALADQDVFYRRFAAVSGAIDPVEQAANLLGNPAIAAGDQGGARVVRLRDSGFLIVYEDRPTARVYGVRFSATGAALDAPGGPPGTKQFRFGSATGDEDGDPSAAALTNGGFVVAINRCPGGVAANRHVRVMVHGSGGLPLAEFTVGAHSNRWENPQVAGLPNGEFAVAWQTAWGEGEAAAGWSVWAQRFSAAGSPRLAPFRVNQFDDGHQRRASVAALQGGGYATAWQSLGQDGDGYGVFARLFDPDNEIPGRLVVSRYGPPQQRQFLFGFVGMGGRTHQLQSAPALGTNTPSWTIILTTNPPTGVFEYLASGSNTPSRFYRVLTP